jgi:hypothetical protein
MTDFIEEQQPAEAEIDELAILKARADLLGIKYHPATGVDKLRTKISNFVDGNKEEVVTSSIKAGDVNYITYEEFRNKEFKLRKQNAGKLIRVRVTCMDPAKKDWDGEIVSVGSAKIGTFKKFVKFNTEDGWHIPYIIYEVLKERKCSVFYTFLDQNGAKIRKSKLVNAFNIEVMPALTKEELKALAVKQAMESGKEPA